MKMQGHQTEVKTGMKRSRQGRKRYSTPRSQSQRQQLQRGEGGDGEGEVAAAQFKEGEREMEVSNQQLHSRRGVWVMRVAASSFPVDGEVEWRGWCE